MGRFSFLSFDWGGRTSRPNVTERSADPSWWKNALGMGNGKKKNATTDNALQLTAVWACVRVKRDTIASMPLRLYKNENGKQLATGHPVLSLYNKPGNGLTPFVFKGLISLNLDLHGNFYAIVMRDTTTRPTELVVVPPGIVTPLQDEGGAVVAYRIKGLEADVPADDMVHVRGITRNGAVGLSPIKEHAQQLGLVFGAEAYGEDFFANGAQLTGTLVSPEKLTPAQVDSIEERWREKYGPSGRNRGSIAVLHSGAQFNKIGVAPEEAQFLQTRQYGNEEISRIFGVPLHMINSLDRSTYNNIEQQALDFYVNTILPLSINIEQELDAKLLRTDEAGTYYSKFQFNSLMRADAQARMNFYKDAIQYGIFSRNEVRALEDQNPIDNPTGDAYYVPANIMPDEVNKTYFQKQPIQTP